MSPPVLPEVDHTAVTPMRFANAAAQSVFSSWNGDQVHMIRHQAIGPYLHLTFSAPFGQQGDVGTIIVFTEEGLHSSVTALGYMVRNTGSYYTSDSGHVRRLIELNSQVKLQLSMVSPEFPATTKTTVGMSGYKLHPTMP
jgi:hypothetical protein